MKLRLYVMFASCCLFSVACGDDEGGGGGGGSGGSGGGSASGGTAGTGGTGASGGTGATGATGGSGAAGGTGGTGAVGGTAGTGATGGSGAAGGTAGTGATGGTGAVGGAGGTATGPVCDPPVEDRAMTPAPDVAALFNNPTELNDPCAFCMVTSCATESAACGSTGTASGNQDDPCWVGGPNADSEGELFCFQRRACEIDAERGYIPGTDDAEAAGGCVTPGCGTLSVATSDAIACLITSCFDKCIPLTGTGCI